MSQKCYPQKITGRLSVITFVPKLGNFNPQGDTLLIHEAGIRIFIGQVMFDLLVILSQINNQGILILIEIDFDIDTALTDIRID